MLTKQRLLAALAAAGLLLAGCSQAPRAGLPEPAVPQPPLNLVLLSLDTLRADHLSLDGYERRTSPQLDRLARRSVVFEQAMATSSWTEPSHMSLFQSRFGYQTGDEALMLAEHLGRRGYRTVAFTGGGMVSGDRGFERGFERYDEDKGGLAVSLPKLEEWLDREAEAPFFAFLHTYDIHHPYDPPEPFKSLYFPQYDGWVRGELTRKILLQLRGDRFFDDLPSPLVLDDDDRRQMVALYDGGIRYTDEWVGRLLDALKRRGLLERTLLVVLSDHGEEFWEHDGIGHGHSLYQELLRVPLLIRLPRGRLGGSRLAETISLVDVVPTVLDLLGQGTDPSFLGRNLVPWMEGGELAPGVVLAETGGKTAVVEPPWKMIIDIRTREVELYHLESDPGEAVDVAEDHPEEVRRFKLLLAELAQAHEAAAQQGEVEAGEPGR